MRKIKKGILVFILAVSCILAGCKQEYSENKTAKDTNQILSEYGNGCDVFQQGETFEQDGMTITVNSSRITKQRDGWDNIIDFFPEEDADGMIIDDSCYFVVNMTIHVDDKEKYPLSIFGFSAVCLDETTGEYVDGSTIVSSTYYNTLPQDIRDSDNLMVDYPKDGEDLVDTDFIFALSDESNVKDGNLYCLKVQSENDTSQSACDKDLAAVVELKPDIEL